MLNVLGVHYPLTAQEVREAEAMLDEVNVTLNKEVAELSMKVGCYHKFCGDSSLLSKCHLMDDRTVEGICPCEAQELRCPNCDVELLDLTCPSCHKIFTRS